MLIDCVDDQDVNGCAFAQARDYVLENEKKK